MKINKPKKKPHKKQINVPFSEEVYDTLEKIADDSNCKSIDVVRHAVDLFLKSIEKETNKEPLDFL